MRTSSTNQQQDQRGLLARLRACSPNRPLSIDEAKVVAERQANALLDWFEVNDAPVPTDLFDGLRRISVVYESTPASGSTHWTGGAWLIVLNESDHPTRQRFSMFHELKHVIDHPMRSTLYPPERGWSAARKVERIADYFAACVLMPKRLVKRHYFAGLQNLDRLAERFEVSPEAMHHRLLDDLGIVDRPRFTYACRSPRPVDHALPFIWRNRSRAPEPRRKVASP